ncbi:hypothetical protein NR996_01930 [Lactobacillus rodentium]|uniref:Uncharacterized protein n=1 Tax=Lactobacillus rodentium TaxID=947835 RepID=A0A2Z6T839_9LACO|nr:hypothetical protein [Lactobacillus rodentium]MCR1894171.1 hypothetical protein [Lactobacillus rodentium]GBG04468.1 hypothetical protein LrDSM24759_03820 [Lactobacillus rodentium]
MTGYQEGMFNAQMSDQTAQVLTNMYQNIDSDSKKAKVAQKNISHAIKDYQKFMEAKRKKLKKQRTSEMVGVHWQLMQRSS